MNAEPWERFIEWGADKQQQKKRYKILNSKRVLLFS